MSSVSFQDFSQLLQTTAGAKWRSDHVETAHFYTNKDIDKLLSETESTVTHELGMSIYSSQQYRFHNVMDLQREVTVKKR